MFFKTLRPEYANENTNRATLHPSSRLLTSHCEIVFFNFPISRSFFSSSYFNCSVLTSWEFWKRKNNSLVLYWAAFYIMVHDSTFCSCYLKEWGLTCSCSEEVLTSWPALLLYCSLRLSRWTILLTSSSSWLKNFSSRSAGFTGLKKNWKSSVSLH